MSPLKEILVLSPEEWEEISKSHPPRGIRGRKETASDVRTALDYALHGVATKLTYDTPGEAYQVAQRIRRYGIRVVQTEYANDHVTIVAGPKTS